ncbi:hypothetical protein SLS56_008349 [Neofusicoccum ribis]|uniref:DUF6594 domain-containing protein n=1 Tax=Neofusicoccum ribis TaxID=45134 RepID=A0ABR3SKC3_9PEZI
MANTQTPIIPLHHGPNITRPESATGSAELAEKNESVTNGAGGTLGATSPRDSPPGYPKLAEVMNTIPETAIFRRFGVLNSLNLLYLQAELMDIEQRLQEAQVADNIDLHGFKSLYAKNWYFLSASAQDGDQVQLKLAELVREKLEKYNAALVQQEKILSMNSPGQYDMDFVQRFLASDESGAAYALTGLDANVWGSFQYPKSRAQDLVTLKPRRNEDVFSNWVTEKGISMFFNLGFARFRKPSLVHGRVGYEDASLLRITYNITVKCANKVVEAYVNPSNCSKYRLV